MVPKANNEILLIGGSSLLLWNRCFCNVSELIKTSGFQFHNSPEGAASHHLMYRGQKLDECFVLAR